ncbi:MAG TPA: hypothetical protein VNI36_11475 [Candidatus Dormibacteraeota bacterium]|nr:hypothetical protein [Candidatus Dormibacteraeota bacterium]
MHRIKACFTILGLIAAIATGVRGAAQVKERKPDAEHAKQVHTVDAANLAPFALDATSQGGGAEVVYRSAQAMTPEDRQAITKAWAGIKKKAAEKGFDVDRKGWRNEQIVSSAFREHVLLLFLDDGSPDERSEFSVIVPLQDNEPLGVIPILRLGYFPYSTPQENPEAMAAFNRALASEGGHEKPNWLSVSSCYAALNGAHAILSSVQRDKESDDPGGWLATPSPSLQVEDGGRAVARFAVQKAPGRFTEWILTFDKKGNLIKAATSPIKAPKFKVVRAGALKTRRH